MPLVPMLYTDWSGEDIDRQHYIPLLEQNLLGTSSVESEVGNLHRSGIVGKHIEHLGYPFFRRIRRRNHPFHHALHQRRLDCGTTGAAAALSPHRDRFAINLDVKQFAHDEILVKTIGERVIAIEANHDEHEDEHGWISRRFTRRYELPPDFDIERIESSLSSDGVLTIEAPRRRTVGANEKIVDIRYTGEMAVVPERQQRSGSCGETRIGDSATAAAAATSRDYSQQRVGQTIAQQRGKKLNVKGI